MFDVFSLMAKLGLDSSEYEDGLDQAGEKASVFSDVLKANLVTKGIDVAIDGFKTLGSVAVGTIEQAVSGFGDYEQLAGGIETMFEGSADKIKAYADEAYKSAGMTANEYMDTIMGFSASLIQSTGRGEQVDTDELKEQLDVQYNATKRTLQDEYDERKKYWDNVISQTKDKSKKTSLKEQRDAELKDLKRNNEDRLAALKLANKEQVAAAESANTASTKSAESLDRAAELANMAIIDMSDNANKMGTDMASIQNAYQGFAKANYTMLDNLKLGYGGTKEEMERLLADAEKLTGKNYNVSSYADIVEAIHAIQTEIGITGTTAEEASGTIQGSIASFKAAWDNLIVGLVRDDVNIDELIDAVVSNGEAALDNVLPTIEKAIDGLGKLIDKLAPVIDEKLPPILDRIIPIITNALSKILTAVLPAVIEIGKSLISALFSALSEEAPALVPVAAAAIALPFVSALTTVIGMIGKVVTAMGGIGTAATAAGAEVTLFGQTVSASMATAITGIAGVFDAIMITYDVNKFKDIINQWNQVEQDTHDARWNEETTYLDNYVKLYNEKGKEVADEFAMMVTGIDTSAMTFEQAQEALVQKVEENWKGVATNIGEGFLGGLDYYFGEGDGGGLVGLVMDGLGGIVSDVKNFLGINSPSKVFYDIGVNIMEGLSKGIDSRTNSLMAKLNNIARSIANTMRIGLKIHSPSKVMEEIGVYTLEGLIEGIRGTEDDLIATMEDVAGDVADDYIGDIDAVGAPIDTVDTMSYSTYVPDILGNSSSSQEMQRPLNIILELDGVQFARTVYTANNEETQRVGVQIGGFA